MMNAITLGFVMVNVLRIRSIYNGKRFRALTVLDMFSRESLAIYVYKLSKSEQVCKEMEILEAARGLPRRIKVDKRPEFISRALDALAYFNRSSSITSAPARRRITLISNRSMAAFGMNV
jgi:transposase InsO family protein